MSNLTPTIMNETADGPKLEEKPTNCRQTPLHPLIRQSSPRLGQFVISYDFEAGSDFRTQNLLIGSSVDPSNQKPQNLKKAKLAHNRTLQSNFEESLHRTRVKGADFPSSKEEPIQFLPARHLLLNSPTHSIHSHSLPIRSFRVEPQHPRNIQRQTDQPNRNQQALPKVNSIGKKKGIQKTVVKEEVDQPPTCLLAPLPLGLQQRGLKRSFDRVLCSSRSKSSSVDQTMLRDMYRVEEMVEQLQKYPMKDKRQFKDIALQTNSQRLPGVPVNRSNQRQNNSRPPKAILDKQSSKSTTFHGRFPQPSRITPNRLLNGSPSEMLRLPICPQTATVRKEHERTEELQAAKPKDFIQLHYSRLQKVRQQQLKQAQILGLLQSPRLNIPERFQSIEAEQQHIDRLAYTPVKQLKHNKKKPKKSNKKQSVSQNSNQEQVVAVSKWNGIQTAQKGGIAKSSQISKGKLTNKNISPSQGSVRNENVRESTESKSPQQQSPLDIVSNGMNQQQIKPTSTPPRQAIPEPTNCNIKQKSQKKGPTKAQKKQGKFGKIENNYENQIAEGHQQSQQSSMNMLKQAIDGQNLSQIEIVSQPQNQDEIRSANHQDGSIKDRQQDSNNNNSREQDINAPQTPISNNNESADAFGLGFRPDQPKQLKAIEKAQGREIKTKKATINYQKPPKLTNQLQIQNLPTKRNSYQKNRQAMPGSSKERPNEHQNISYSAKQRKSEKSNQKESQQSIRSKGNIIRHSNSNKNKSMGSNRTERGINEKGDNQENQSQSQKQQSIGGLSNGDLQQPIFRNQVKASQESQKISKNIKSSSRNNLKGTETISHQVKHKNQQKSQIFPEDENVQSQAGVSGGRIQSREGDKELSEGRIPPNNPITGSHNSVKKQKLLNNNQNRPQQLKPFAGKRGSPATKHIQMSVNTDSVAFPINLNKQHDLRLNKQTVTIETSYKNHPKQSNIETHSESQKQFHPFSQNRTHQSNNKEARQLNGPQVNNLKHPINFPVSRKVGNGKIVDNGNREENGQNRQVNYQNKGDKNGTYKSRNDDEVIEGSVYQYQQPSRDISLLRNLSKKSQQNTRTLNGKLLGQKISDNSHSNFHLTVRDPSQAPIVQFLYSIPEQLKQANLTPLSPTQQTKQILADYKQAISQLSCIRNYLKLCFLSLIVEPPKQDMVGIWLFSRGIWIKEYLRTSNCRKIQQQLSGHGQDIYDENSAIYQIIQSRLITQFYHYNSKNNHTVPTSVEILKLLTGLRVNEIDSQVSQMDIVVKAIRNQQLILASNSNRCYFMTRTETTNNKDEVCQFQNSQESIWVKYLQLKNHFQSLKIISLAVPITHRLNRSVHQNIEAQYCFPYWSCRLIGHKPNQRAVIMLKADSSNQGCARIYNEGTEKTSLWLYREVDPKVLKLIGRVKATSISNRLYFDFNLEGTYYLFVEAPVHSLLSLYSSRPLAQMELLEYVNNTQLDNAACQYTSLAQLRPQRPHSILSNTNTFTHSFSLTKQRFVNHLLQK